MLRIVSILSYALSTYALTCYDTSSPTLPDLMDAIRAGRPIAPSFTRVPVGSNVETGCYACMYASVNDNPYFNDTNRPLSLSRVMMVCAKPGNYSNEINDDGVIGDLILHNREYKAGARQSTSGPLPITLADRNVVGPLRSLATMLQGDCASISLNFKLPSGYANVGYCCQDYCNSGPQCLGSSMGSRMMGSPFASRMGGRWPSQFFNY